MYLTFFLLSASDIYFCHSLALCAKRGKNSTINDLVKKKEIISFLKVAILKFDLFSCFSPELDIILVFVLAFPKSAQNP